MYFHFVDLVLATSGIDYDVKLWSPTAEIAHLPDIAAEVCIIDSVGNGFVTSLPPTPQQQSLASGTDRGVSARTLYLLE